MTASPDVSAIIPTYNRRDLVSRAIRSALAQTYPVDEIIVIDDGSTDGTGEMLQAEFGDRIVYVRQANAGVSAARNHGMSIARGRYLALLDSDDEWLPEKTRLQVDFLEANPTFGMVLCNVERVDRDGRTIDFLMRRSTLPEDGWVLRWVLQDPALAPVSAILRREVFEQVGGFDETLTTAEDLDFHLRIAAAWPIGVIDETLARALRGHDGLSSLSRTYDDYTTVIERAVAQAAGHVDADERGRALARAYLRNARGMIFEHRWRTAWNWVHKARSVSPDPSIRRETRALFAMGMKRFALSFARRPS